jgi:hypothetical protein
MRRVVSLLLPTWPTDRPRRPECRGQARKPPLAVQSARGWFGRSCVRYGLRMGNCGICAAGERQRGAALETRLDGVVSPDSRRSAPDYGGNLREVVTRW